MSREEMDVGVEIPLHGLISES